MPQRARARVRTSPVQFVTASVRELRRVTWTQRTVVQHSAVVALVVALMMIVLVLVDAFGSMMFESLTR